MTTRRRAIAAALAVAVVVVVPSALLPAAGQAAAYRYWSYWLGTDGAWTFATVGPAFRVPADGTLEGWRFSVSGVEGNHTPSFTADFGAVCGDTAPEDGRKRVAVVVDPGLAADAPEGEQPPGAWAMCVVAQPRATGYDVLRAAATVRAERGLICGIGGYPAQGCADVISDPTPSPTPTPTKSPKPSPEPTRTADPAEPDPSATRSPEPDPSTTRSPEPDPSTTSATGAALPQPTSPAPPVEESWPSPTPSPTPSTSPPQIPEAAPTPEPTYSLLTSPLQEPPSDSGSGGALVAGIAVVGIAGLGGAAILRMRRSS